MGSQHTDKLVTHTRIYIQEDLVLFDVVVYLESAKHPLLDIQTLKKIK